MESGIRVAPRPKLFEWVTIISHNIILLLYVQFLPESYLCELSGNLVLIQVLGKGTENHILFLDVRSMFSCLCVPKSFTTWSYSSCTRTLSEIQNVVNNRGEKNSQGAPHFGSVQSKYTGATRWERAFTTETCLLSLTHCTVKLRCSNLSRMSSNFTTSQFFLSRKQ